MSISSRSPEFINYLTDIKRCELTVFDGGCESALPRGYVSGPFIRDCYIFEYCVRGTGVYTINQNSFDIFPGQCFVIFPGAVVTLRSDQVNPWAKTWLCFYGSRIAHYLGEIGVTEDSPLLPWIDNIKLLNFMYEAFPVLERTGNSAYFEQIACANSFFALLSQLNSQTHPIDSPYRSPDRYVAQALRYIEDNYTKRIKVSDIASHLGLNRTYFSTIFKEHMNISPQDFVLNYCIRKSQDFFANPHSTVTSVAYSLGYEPNVFSRLFKKITGQTPVEYKNSLTNP